MKNVVVVGGNGFIGKSIVKKFRSQGMAVDVVDRGSFERLEDPCDILIWSAGYTADYAESPAKTIQAHAMDLAKVVENQRYARLIYLSSTRLYDGLPGPVSEETPIALESRKERSLFDLSKAMGEWLVCHRGGPRAHVLRLSGVYSDALDGGSFLETMILRALDGQGGSVDALGTTRRDYIHIEDVCQVVLAVAEVGQYSLYNVAAGDLVTNNELFSFLRDRTGTRLSPSEMVIGDTEPCPPAVIVRRIESDLGLVPRQIEVGLDRVLTWQDNQRAMRSMMSVSHMPWM
ncbi:MAG: NAD-dependent epimerase/dehydratase family protein [Myxococcales bacterium]|nr:NAD-dependent epimerase/dehydratase family protein [Myxococcales bacterium]